MRKNIYLLLTVLLFCATALAQPYLQQTRHYTWHVNTGSYADSVISGLEGIRCVAVADVNNDGKNEIMATNYNDNGHVHLFAAAGKDTFELVWSSPKILTNGAYSSPRNVIVGDLDNDGRKEIIFESRNNGIFIYEWDGNPGYNFGTQASQLINSINCPGFPVLSGSSYVEKMSVADMDNDGQQELVLAYRAGAAAEQKYMIIKATGDWSTNDAGFSSFELLFSAARTTSVAWGLNNGGAIGMMPANLDGTGYKEAVLQCYDFNNITILRHNGTQWVLGDTTNGKGNLRLTPGDGVSYFGGLVCDIDKDGRDEVYLPTNIYTAPDPAGIVRVVYYDAPAVPTEIDSTKNIFKLDFSTMTGTNGLWGYGSGDIDGNGKPNIYFTTDHLGAAIVTAEFQGGNKTDTLNWKKSILWKGDTCFYSMTIRDSLGKVDTLTYANEFLFPSKMVSADFDKNGKEDIIVGYQPWYYGAPNTDSIRMTKYTWNVSTSKYDSVKYKILNPKRIGFVVLEAGGPNGVEARDLTLITPEDYRLEQNYPNPFNPATEINFTLPLTKKITLKVYDMVGREVRTLINGDEYAKGSHSVSWNGKDNFGKSAASGSYVYTLRTGNVVKSMKMMLLK